MCAPNKTKKRNNALSYLFRTRLVITISPYLSTSGRLGAMSRMEVFLHQAWIVCQWIALLRCSTTSTKMLIATKHIADNNFVSVKQRTDTSCMQHSPNLSTSLFHFNFSDPTAQMSLVNPTDYK